MIVLVLQLGPIRHLSVPSDVSGVTGFRRKKLFIVSTCGEALVELLLPGIILSKSVVFLVRSTICAKLSFVKCDN